MHVDNKVKKLPVHWSSKVPFKYKRNAITGEPHRAKIIASDFDEETKRIRSKYTDARYPKHVIESTIKNINRKKDELLIWQWLSEAVSVSNESISFKHIRNINKAIRFLIEKS